MFKCPVCGSKTDVLDSRNSVKDSIRRRRICRRCNRRFTTREMIREKAPKKVRLRDYSIQPGKIRNYTKEQFIQTSKISTSLEDMGKHLGGISRERVRQIMEVFHVGCEIKETLKTNRIRGVRPFQNI